MNLKKQHVLILFLAVLFPLQAAGTHPGLFLTPKGVKEIRSSLGKYPFFDGAYRDMKQIADHAVGSVIEVPVPVDGGGGYTHEKHKNNYYEMQAAGILFQVTKDKKYAEFVKNMLLKYAEMYPGLGLHPMVKSATPGKLFWQALNESVWLVHTSMAYDCVYDYITGDDRKFIEENLFYPMCEFLSNGNPGNHMVFNKMHNHGTWATAAVGMAGYVMGDRDLIDKALYGSAKDGKSGFIRQLDVLFSPDGYFTEGPYYQRYAIWPFMTFAQVIQNQQPELEIFEYRNGILFQAVHRLIESSYQGEIFYMNDALKKTFKTQEIVYAVDIAYRNNPADKSLLDIVRQQGACIVSDAGLATAKAFYKEKKIQPYAYHSFLMRDGMKGDEGGVAVMRDGSHADGSCFTFKATSHGLSHGHYDKLTIAYYDDGNPVLTDYGAVRFLNIEPKNGGHYTPENYSWAMQTIAHNTVTLNQESHFNADIKVSSEYHPEILFADFAGSGMQVVSASEKHAYPGVSMQRTSSMVKHPAFEFPVVIDLFRVGSPQTVETMDLPFYYQGQMVSVDFKYDKQIKTMSALGEQNGYQHLWLEAKGKSEKPSACFTWVNGTRFYSITTLTDPSTELMMTRIGAGDSLFNLRNDPAFMLRVHDRKAHTFVSVIEPHGLYDISREVTEGYRSGIESLKLISDNEVLSVVEIKTRSGQIIVCAFVNEAGLAVAAHRFEYNGQIVKFTGKFFLKEF